jgi:hypothetical protein
MMNLFFGNQILVCPILEPNAVLEQKNVSSSWYLVQLLDQRTDKEVLKKFGLTTRRFNEI